MEEAPTPRQWWGGEEELVPATDADAQALFRASEPVVRAWEQERAGADPQPAGCPESIFADPHWESLFPCPDYPWAEVIKGDAARMDRAMRAWWGDSVGPVSGSLVAGVPARHLLLRMYASLDRSKLKHAPAAAHRVGKAHAEGENVAHPRAISRHSL